MPWRGVSPRNPSEWDSRSVESGDLGLPSSSLFLLLGPDLATPAFDMNIRGMHVRTRRGAAGGQSGMRAASRALDRIRIVANFVIFARAYCWTDVTSK